ncbi:MAG: hypothetical protein J6P94_02170 [Oscillospiraceae bacterium]|nr:hypothetical protein [Oscillospiraceae bacterium]
MEEKFFFMVHPPINKRVKNEIHNHNNIWGCKLTAKKRKFIRGENLKPLSLRFAKPPPLVREALMGVMLLK